jgi:hypothetical protein
MADCSSFTTVMVRVERDRQRFDDDRVIVNDQNPFALHGGFRQRFLFERRHPDHRRRIHNNFFSPKKHAS